MTDQVPDNFIYKGKKYYIAVVKGVGLFNPMDYNIKPRMASTACWRGFVCTYECRENNLILSSLQIKTDEPHEINGKKPEKGRELFSHEYLNLDLKVDFTGTMLIGKNLIQAMSTYVGYQRPNTFETVYELHFQKGQFTEEKDLAES